MNNSTTIRKYDPSDKNTVIGLLRENTPNYFAKEEEKELINYLENEIELYYILLFDDKIIGSGGINFSEDKKTGIISWDILHPEYQGKSFGSQLLKYRIEKLNSIESIEHTIVRTSQLTYKFYEKQGFETLEIIKDYWAKGFDLYSMKYVQ
ncbi:MAG: GNAT family N-acetyltransferase [Crocinitomicaceae bacterium]